MTAGGGVAPGLLSGENECMTRAKHPTAAYAIYESGHSLRAVAAQLGLGRATVERWSVRYDWVEACRSAFV